MRPQILGTGICAKAVVDSFPLNSLDIIQPTGIRSNCSLTHQGINFTVADSSIGGLSNRYHGVTPGQTINKPAYESYLKNLKLKCLSRVSDNTYFVPWRVPRPDLKATRSINIENVNFRKQTFLCLSVMGNLTFLQNAGYISNNLDISDDLIINFGIIADLPKHLRPLYFIGGTVFPVIKIPNGIITFRPIFGRADSLDFTKNIISQFFNGGHQQIKSKIQQAIYLKFGLQLSFKKPRAWAAVLQLNVPNIYRLSHGILSFNGDIRKKTQKSLSHATKILVSNLPNSKVKQPEYFNGIHLGYNRNILSGIPKQINVFDMSLNEAKGQHPTLQVYCDIREKLVDQKT